MRIWNKLLPLGAFFLLIAGSCDQENTGIDNIENKTSNGYLSVRFTAPDSEKLTRTNEDVQGTTSERKVSTIHILLYNVGDNSSRLIYNIKLDASTDGINKFAGTDVVERGAIISLHNQFVSAGKPIKKQDYQMVVLVNATQSILAKAKAEADYPSGYNRLSDLLERVEDTNATDYYNNDTGNFFMSNAYGLIYIPASSLGKDSVAAENAPVTVRVERLVAKILVYENTERPLENAILGGKIGPVTWGVDVANKQTYLLRIPDKVKGGDAEDSYQTDRSLVYAKDPNFDNNNTIITDNNLISEHYDLMDINNQSLFIPWNTTADNSSYYRYMLENTTSQEEQVLDSSPKKYTTQAYLKVVITEPGDLVGVTDYYSYYNGSAWKVFTHKQAVEWYAKGIKDKQTFPSDMTGLSGVIEKADSLPGFDFTKNDGAPSAYTKTDLGLTYHAGGLNIYSLPVMHFGAGDKTMTKVDYGYYGVVRNNTYRIVINSINGPGTLTEFDNISAEITINEWHPRNSYEDL